MYHKPKDKGKPPAENSPGSLNGGSQAISLRGSLDTFKLPDVLQFVRGVSQSGCLIISRAEESRFVYFTEGEPVFVSSTRDNERLLWVLREERLVPDQELVKAFSVCHKYRRHLGSYFAKRDVGLRKRMEELIREQALENLYDLFFWQNGDFEFLSGKEPPRYAVTFSLQLERLLLDAMVRVDELKRFGLLLSHLDDVPRLTIKGTSVSRRLDLSGLDRELLSLINGNRSLSQIMSHAPPLGYYRIMTRIYDFSMEQWIEFQTENDDTDGHISRGFEESTAEDGRLAGQMAVEREPMGVLRGEFALLDVDGHEIDHHILDSSCTIGRGFHADLILKGDQRVSRLHARVRMLGQTYIIEDLESINGLFVNNQAVTQHPLREGDICTIGKFRLRFHVSNLRSE